MSSTSAMFLPLKPYLERFAVISLAFANLAGDVDIRQEVHLDLDDSLACARFTAAALDVERESSGLVSAHSRFRHAGEQLAQRRESCRCRLRDCSRRSPDR